MIMRTSSPGRRRLAASLIAAVSLLPLTTGSPGVAAGEGVHGCLMSEADQFFTRLAAAIGASEVEAASIDDDYIARESEPILTKCVKEADPSADAGVAAFRAHMARWSYHLDSKLSSINARGAPD
jgi:hypothetical protein